MTYEGYRPHGPAGPGGAPPVGRGLILAGIVAGVVGLALAVVSFVLLIGGAVSAFSDQLNAPLLSYPGSISLSLDGGSYLVFQNVDDLAPFGPAQISLSAPDGSILAIGDPTYSEQVDRGGSHFDAVAAFDVPKAGTYEMTVVVASDAGGQMIVARGTESAVAARGWWGLGIGGGGLVLVLGIALLAVGLTRRRRARTAQLAYGAPGQPYATAYRAAYPAAQQYAQQYAQPYPSQSPPAGWYPDPDPSRPGGQRYWDGSAWTGHTA